jgi:hypothetical protein
MIWGGLKIIEYCLHLTNLVPGFLVEYFYKHQFLMTFPGYMTGWLFFTLFSVVASLLYAALFSKTKGPWAGIGYGLIWWGLLYLYIGPATGMMPWVYLIGWNTIVTDLSLFLLWGLFIGYSIAVEFTDERQREPATAK